jgi:ABC-type branched-subunit amino acid transport system permease subunit
MTEAVGARTLIGRSAARRIELVHWVVAAAVAVALWVVPLFASRFVTGQVARILVFGIAALGLDLIWGYTGQLRLGHAAFFGLGAYATGLVLVHLGNVPAAGLLAIVAGVAVPTTLAYLMARTLIHGNVTGAYFAIITLLVSLILEQLATTLIGITGGINGLYGMAPIRIGPWELWGLLPSYYTIVVCALVAYAIARRLVRSPIGRAMEGVRTNEQRTASLGYPTSSVRTIAFVVGAAITGLAGMLYVPLEQFVYPTQLGVLLSTSIIVWVAIGGRRSLVGPFIGAFVVSYGQSLLSDRLQQYWVLATGVFLVVVVLTQPRGLVGLVSTAVRRVRGHREER